MSQEINREIIELRERITKLEQRIEILEKLIIESAKTHENYFKIILLLISIVGTLAGIKAIIP